MLDRTNGCDGFQYIFERLAPNDKSIGTHIAYGEVFKVIIVCVCDH